MKLVNRKKYKEIDIIYEIYENKFYRKLRVLQ